MGRVRRSTPHSKVPLHRLVRANPELARRWLVVLALAGCTALVVGSSITSAEAARSRWGRTVPVLVTVSPIRAGLPFGSQVELRRWPAAIAPPGALSEITPGASPLVDLEAGVPLTPSVVSRTGAAAGDQEVAAGEIVVTKPPAVHGGDDISQLQGELLKGAGVFFGGQAGGFEKVVAQGEAGGDLGVKQEAVAPAGGATGLPAGQGAIGGHAGFRQAAGAEKRPAGRIAKQVGREGVEAAGGAVTRGGRGGDLQDAGRVGSRQNQGIDFVAGIARGEAGKGAGLARR